MLLTKLSSRKVSVVVFNSERSKDKGKESKDIKHWPHVHVSGVLARTELFYVKASDSRRVSMC